MTPARRASTTSTRSPSLVVRTRTGSSGPAVDSLGLPSARKLMTSSAMTPMTIAESATLKTGQTWRSRKSTTLSVDVAQDAVGEISEAAPQHQSQGDRQAARLDGARPEHDEA